MDGPEDEEDPEEDMPLLKRFRMATPDPTDSDDSDVETLALVAPNGVLSETEDEEDPDNEEDDEDVPLLARRRSKRSCGRKTLPPSPPPKPTWTCGTCTFENDKMEANVCLRSVPGRA